jgi:3',5'-cyclic AMP phosphodiesterase CpdA
MFTLAHLSDPHLGPLPDPQFLELASKRVVGYVNWHRNRAVKLSNSALDALVADIHARVPDHIVVTGDLVNLSLAGEMGPAARWLGTLGPPAEVSVVPGNHDAYVPGALGRARRIWAAHLSGDPGDHHSPGRPHFPYLRRRQNVAIIGASSARATAPFLATGHFDTHQQLLLTEMLQATAHQGLFRVVLIHHPPGIKATAWHKRMIGSARFRAAIDEGGAELVLHGHTHKPSIAWLNGRDGLVPVVGVPSASAMPHGRNPSARYNHFTIGGAPGAWTCRLEERGVADRSMKVETVSIVDLHGGEAPVVQGDEAPTPREAVQPTGGQSGATDGSTSPSSRGSGTISTARR